jgi:urea transport system ATP-binding protein
LNAIVGLIPTQAVELLMSGVSIERLAVHDRVRAGIVFVPQGKNVFLNLTVLEQLALAARASNKRRSRSEILDVAVQFLGSEELLDKRGVDLSGGQRQMVCVVRAALQEPRFLLLDEPTTGLDRVSISQVPSAIRRLASRTGVGVFIVEHRLDLLRDLVTYHYAIAGGTLSGRISGCPE